MMPSAVIAPRTGHGTQMAAAHARQIIMQMEHGLGFEPMDREADKLGYDL